MTPTQVMAALRDHWDEVWALLDDPTRTALLGLVERLPEDPERVSRKISRLLLAAGPQAYVLFGASTSDSVRFIPGPHEAPGLLVALAVSLRELGRRTAPVLSEAGGAPPADPASPRQADEQQLADDRLLATGNVTAAEYRAGGHDPADPDLIRLTDRQGTVRLPSFQFDGASGHPLPLVVEVNRLLDADDDPWGVADWWLGANSWLDAVPARLLGTPDERSLLAAARAEIAEW
ncbi:DUF3168 domain-containing protein [Kitasatospora sp. NBC_00458]|uniref:DUF3168 domain-containing protein n=1 Tax=Kitasatospora sp. NBC_00458 TaxID=2903568 RepID=UPI002E19347A